MQKCDLSNGYPLSSEKNTSIIQYIPWKSCSFSFYQFQAMQKPA